MESEKIKTVLNINGDLYPFRVKREDEPYFREAKDIINERLASLKNDYSAYTTPEKLMGVVAIEALVDALQVNEKYQKLREVAQERLNNIELRFDN
jgi:cell division protein ZapA (FtsZ GTPase activity inhibitor)